MLDNERIEYYEKIRPVGGKVLLEILTDKEIKELEDRGALPTKKEDVKVYSGVRDGVFAFHVKEIHTAIVRGVGSEVVCDCHENDVVFFDIGATKEDRVSVQERAEKEGIDVYSDQKYILIENDCIVAKLGRVGTDYAERESEEENG